VFVAWLLTVPPVVLWLPLAVWLADRAVGHGRARDWAALSLALGAQFTGAYLSPSLVVVTVTGAFAMAMIVARRRWSAVPWLATTGAPIRPKWRMLRNTWPAIASQAAQATTAASAIPPMRCSALVTLRAVINSSAVTAVRPCAVQDRPHNPVWPSAGVASQEKLRLPNPAAAT
jgi:hypothetical protein